MWYGAMEDRLGLMKGREIEIRENERRRIWDPSRRKGLKGSNGMTRRRSLTSLGPPRKSGRFQHLITLAHPRSHDYLLCRHHHPG